MHDPCQQEIIVITGATASGKSAFIQKLGQELPIEVINADSRQIYQYMEIGTATPTLEEQKQVPHHLISLLKPNKKCTAGYFVHHAKEAIKKIICKNKIPVLCGGTFFYIKSLWDGLLEEPEIPETLSQEINQLDDTKVEQYLQEKDPTSYQNITKNNFQRMRRALLITLAGNKPFSQFQKKGGIYDEYKFKNYYIHLPRNEFYSRIDHRVIQMIENGWIDEINQLIKMGYTLKDPGLQTIGYKEILEWHFNSNNTKTLKKEMIPEVIIQQIQQHTRHYAKRQYTWFRGEKRLEVMSKNVLTSYFFHPSSVQTRAQVQKSSKKQ